jgi:hypothetical protein
MTREESGRVAQAARTIAETTKFMGRQMAIAKSEEDVGFLGWQLMSSFRRMEIPKDKVIEWFENQTVLNELDMPSMPSNVDAFQKACSAENVAIWEPLKQYINDARYMERYGGELVNIRFLTIPVKGRNTEYILEQRVWLVCENRMVRPEHPNIARIKLDKDGGSWDITVTMFDGFEEPELMRAILAIVTQEYRRRLSIVDDVRVRNALYSLVSNVGGVRWMSGGNNGCYFIPPAGKPKVEAFIRFVEEVGVPHCLDPYYRTLIRLTPLVDQEIMREYLVEDVKNETEERWAKICDDALNFVNRKAREGKLDDEKAAEILEKRLYEVEKLRANKEDYERVLGMKIALERRPTKNALDSSVPTSGRVAAMLDQLANALQ